MLLNGVNLGGWAVQEGYIIKPGWGGINGKQTQGTVKQTLYNFGMSDAAVESFYQSYRNNFITKADIDYIASKGFNCVRLPLHYDLFLTPAQRAVRNSRAARHHHVRLLRERPHRAGTTATSCSRTRPTWRPTGMIDNTLSLVRGQQACT